MCQATGSMSPETAKQPTVPGVANLLFTTVLGTRVRMIQIPEVLKLMEMWIKGERAQCRQIVVTGDVLGIR